MTIVDVLLAFPIAYFMARFAGTRMRAVMFMLVLLPLWSSYLVRVYAWRVILAKGGPLEWAFAQIGIPGVVLYPSDIAILIVFSYIWLPYMILPDLRGPRAHPVVVPRGVRSTSAPDRGTTFRTRGAPAGVPGGASRDRSSRSR